MRSGSRCQTDLLSRDRLLLALPVTLALAAALAACGPTPIGTPMPDPYPGATGTSADPYPLGTPMTPTRLPDTPTPAGVPVALTLDEAAEQALWLVNPNSEPRVLFSRFALARDIHHSYLNFGHNVMYALKSMDPLAPVIIVGIEQRNAMVSIDAIRDDPQSLDGPWLTGATYDPASGKLVQAGGLAADSLAAVDKLPKVLLTPVLGPSPTPTPDPTRRWPAPTPTALPDGLLSALPADLRGQPLARGLVDNAVLTALEGWPLLPGNRWVYQMDGSDDGAWIGAVITETVESAHVLRPDVLMVAVRSTAAASPGTAEVLARGWHFNYVNPENLPGERAKWYIVYGSEVYSAEDAEEAEAIARWIIDPGATPGGTPNPRFGAGRQWLPMVRFPLVVGDQRAIEIPEFIEGWTIGKQEPIDTAAGRLGGCFSDGHTGGNALEVRWFCPGIGLARHAFAHTMFQFNRHLSSYEMAMTVDDLR
jgi:hypothetical protein